MHEGRRLQRETHPAEASPATQQPQPVIPAKAGIRSTLNVNDVCFPKRLDSGFRRNDVKCQRNLIESYYFGFLSRLCPGGLGGVVFLKGRCGDGVVGGGVIGVGRRV